MLVQLYTFLRANDSYLRHHGLPQLDLDTGIHPYYIDLVQ